MMFTKSFNEISALSASLFKREMQFEEELADVAREKFKEAGMPSVLERNPEPWLLEFLRENKIGVTDVETTTYIHMLPRIQYDRLLNTLKGMCNERV